MRNLPFWPFNAKKQAQNASSGEGGSEQPVTPAAPGLRTAKEALDLLLKGRAPEGMVVKEPLSASGSKTLTRLPHKLTVNALNLSNCTALEEIPSDIKARRLFLNGCTSLWFLPQGLSVYELQMRDTKLISVPEDLRVRYMLDLQNSRELKRLPDGLCVNSLILRDCVSLEALPEGLSVRFLDISGCVGLQAWPKEMTIHTGRLSMRNCPQFTELPQSLTLIAQLDLRGCSGITKLPEGLVVTSWIDIAGTGITSLPDSMRKTDIRWKGVRVSRRVAFEPEAITYQEVLETRNVEQRRVLLERMGYERFMQQANAKVLDQDNDPGGARRLLKVSMQADEDLVCLAVTCPSTGRQYMLRVPPTTRSCHQAAAWIAGFDNAKDYRPLKET